MKLCILQERLENSLLGVEAEFETEVEYENESD